MAANKFRSEFQEKKKINNVSRRKKHLTVFYIEPVRDYRCIGARVVLDRVRRFFCPRLTPLVHVTKPTAGNSLAVLQNRNGLQLKTNAAGDGSKPHLGDQRNNVTKMTECTRCSVRS